jgi:hypothetical protein
MVKHQNELDLPFLTHFLVRNGLDDIPIHKCLFWVSNNIDDCEITTKHKCYSYMNQVCSFIPVDSFHFNLISEALFTKCVKYREEYQAVHGIGAESDNEKDSDEDEINFDGLSLIELQSFVTALEEVCLISLDCISFMLDLLLRADSEGRVPWTKGEVDALSDITEAAIEQEGLAVAATEEELALEKQTNELLASMRENQVRFINFTSFLDFWIFGYFFSFFLSFSFLSFSFFFFFLSFFLFFSFLFFFSFFLFFFFFLVFGFWFLFFGGFGFWVFFSCNHCCLFLEDFAPNGYD